MFCTTIFTQYNVHCGFIYLTIDLNRYNINEYRGLWNYAQELQAKLNKRVAECDGLVSLRLLT